LATLTACQTTQTLHFDKPPPASLTVGDVTVNYVNWFAREKAQFLATLANKRFEEVIDYLYRNPSPNVSPRRNRLDITVGNTGGNFSAITKVSTGRIILSAEKQQKSPGRSLVHEITHSVASQPHPAVALFSEGLANHVHDKLAIKPYKYSTRNIDFHVISASLPPQLYFFRSPDKIARQGMVLSASHQIGLADKRALASMLVTVAIGTSFSIFLIEQYGIQKFMRAYHSGDFLPHYGKSMTDLQEEWRRFLYQYRKTNIHKFVGKALPDRPLFLYETSDAFICKSALTRDTLNGKAYWDPSANREEFVEEAKRRGFSENACGAAS